MSAIIRIVTESYEKLDKGFSDPRTENFLFMSSVIYPLTIIGVYYYFVRHLGPKLMKDRTPFNLRNTILIYNLVQVLLNIFLFTYVLNIWFIDDYKFVCEPIDRYSEKHTGDVRLSWLYFILKVSDLLDTVFFVLRKKDKQATFLHVYHHTCMVFFMWIGVKYAPDGHGVLLGLLNTGVHSVMYSYYLVSNWNPSYITTNVKKTVTQIQMLQFLILMLQNAMALFKKDCEFPKIFIMPLLIQATFMFFMFSDFYIRTYRKKKPQ